MKTVPFTLARTALLPLLMAACCLPASAHRTWLLPSATLLESREPWVTIDAAVSENLFDLDTNGLKLEGLSILDPDGQSMAAVNIFNGALRNSFDLKLSKPGTYKVSLVNKSVMVSYKLNGEPKRWRGSEDGIAREIPAAATDVRQNYQYARLETWVSAGKPDKKVLKVSGSGLEMLPLSHPNDMRSGEKAAWRFLFDGKPLPHFAFSLVPGGVRYRGVLNELRLSTDANGEASLTLPEAGMYWLNAGYPANQGKGGNGNLAGAAAMLATPSATVGGTAGSTAGSAAGSVAVGEAAAAAVTRRYSYSATLEILPQ